MTSDPKWSMPVYIAKTSDPIWNIYRTNGAGSGYVAFTVHVPVNLVVGKGGGDELALIDPTHEFVIEMINAVVLPNGDIQAPFPNKINL